jgi:hypothetical protein
MIAVQPDTENAAGLGSRRSSPSSAESATIGFCASDADGLSFMRWSLRHARSEGTMTQAA